MLFSLNLFRCGLDDRFLLRLSKKNGRLDLLSRLDFYFECHGFVIILMKRLGTFYQPRYIVVCFTYMYISYSIQYIYIYMHV